MILRNQRSKKVLKTGEYVEYWYRNYKMLYIFSQRNKIFLMANLCFNKIYTPYL